MGGIKGVLFDKDGTLLDYRATWMPLNRMAALAVADGDEALSGRLLAAGGYEAAYDRVGAEAPLAAGNTREIAAAWRPLVPARPLDDLVALIDGVFQAEGPDRAVPVPGLHGALTGLKARGLCLGVASSDSHQGIAGSLGRLGVVELFDYLAGYDSGHGVKPGPGMVMGFRAAGGLAPGEVAVVGDTPHDMEMGRRAGAALCVGVLTGTGTRDDLARAADFVLDGIADLAALLDRL